MESQNIIEGIERTEIVLERAREKIAVAQEVISESLTSKSGLPTSAAFKLQDIDFAEQIIGCATQYLSHLRSGSEPKDLRPADIAEELMGGKKLSPDSDYDSDEDCLF